MSEQFKHELWMPGGIREDASQSHQDDRTATLDAKVDYDTSNRNENYLPTGEPSSNQPGFVIDSEDKANWYLRKLANIQAEGQRIHRQYLAIMQDLNSDRDNLVARHQSDLEHWAKENLAKGKRNIKLLQGTVSFRTVPACVRLADPEAAMQWAKQTGYYETDLVVTTERIDANKYKELFKKTGELLPGIEITPEHESCSISFGKKE